MIVNYVISKENIKDDLIMFGDFDNDANGSNGEEYLKEEAKNAGFDNNLEFWATIAEKKLKETDNLNSAIAEFMIHFMNSWDGYSKYLEYDTHDYILNNDSLMLLTFVSS